jgi:hypothetical protein
MALRAKAAIAAGRGDLDRAESMLEEAVALDPADGRSRGAVAARTRSGSTAAW